MRIEAVDGGKPFDWGKTSADYARFRDIYPDSFYQHILRLGLCGSGQQVLDIGTGTGVLPRNMYRYGADWVGVDASERQIEQAQKLAAEGKMAIRFITGRAEELKFPKNTFDVITACQCIWYLDHTVTAPEFAHLLKPGGSFLILYMGWLPFADRIAEKSEALILKYNPTWTGGGDTKQPVRVPDAYMGYFDLVSRAEFDADIPFTRASWHGRMCACRGVGASMTDAERSAWEKEHYGMLMHMAPECFTVKHYIAIAELRVKK